MNISKCIPKMGITLTNPNNVYIYIYNYIHAYVYCKVQAWSILNHLTGWINDYQHLGS